MEWRFTLRSSAVAVCSLSLVAHAGGSLDARLRGLLGSDLVKGALVSMDVVEVTGGSSTELFAHDATLPLGPASNCKLLTTAAAFETYGPGASFKTTLYQIGPDLLLMGGGDPALGDAKLSDDPVTAVFQKWGEALAKAGIMHYRDLIVDDRVFDTEWVHPNWPADQRLDWYSAPVGGLNFNANCLDWIPEVTAHGVGVGLIPNTTYVSVAMKATRGGRTLVSMVRPADSNKFEMRGTVSATATMPLSVPIYDPGLWTGTILRDTLASEGISSEGHVRRVGAQEQPGAGTVVASASSPILAVIHRANTDSLNMMAECLCKRLGHDATGQPGSWENGPAAVKAYLTKLGVEESWATLDDGSGLSSKNKVASKAFTTVLAHVAGRSDAAQFISTLAMPGESGTLKNRFRGMACAASIHAKTGHISGVSTLSGYIVITDKGGAPRKFVFSILCNKYKGNVNPWQDQVCEAIYEWAIGK